MSETTITPGTEEIVIVDGSKVSDESQLANVVTALRDAVKRGLTGYRSMTTTLKRAAELRVAARSLLILPDGHPDWAAKSDAYRLHVAAAETETWTAANVTADEKRRIDQSIRQHVNRTFLRPGIEEYVKRGLPADATPEAIAEAMAEEYRAAKLTIPADLPGGKPANTGGGGGGGETAEAKAAFESAVTGVNPETLTPVVIARGILRATSETAAWALTPNRTITDRPEFVLLLERLAVVANVAAKELNGKATDADRKALAVAMFDAAKETQNT